MARLGASVRERKRTYEGCLDLHQTQSVLAAVSGRQALGETPSFGPMQEDLRICFEAPEDGQEAGGNRASEDTHIATQHVIVRCSMTALRDRVKDRAGNFADHQAALSRPVSERGHTPGLLKRADMASDI